MNFVQAMIVPTMVSLGVGTLLVAQNLSLMEVSYAAPAPAPVGGAAPGAAAAGDPAKPGAKPGKPGAKPGDAAAPGPGALPLPNGGSNSPEFGGKGPDGTVIRAITENELQIKAVESSGREDPFMALVPPEASQIIPPPLPALGPITVPPIATPAPVKPVAPPVAPVKPAVTTPVVPVPKPTPKKEDLPFAGDKAPPAQEPQWLIRGVISTGLERVCLLEGRDEQIHGRVGDKLSDGSVIEAISNRGVTFLRSGRRFVKLIGGQL